MFSLRHIVAAALFCFVAACNVFARSFVGDRRICWRVKIKKLKSSACGVVVVLASRNPLAVLGFVMDFKKLCCSAVLLPLVSSLL